MKNVQPVSNPHEQSFNNIVQGIPQELLSIQTSSTTPDPLEKLWSIYTPFPSYPASPAVQGIMCKTSNGPKAEQFYGQADLSNSVQIDSQDVNQEDHFQDISPCLRYDSQFHPNQDVSMTYLGTKDNSADHKMEKIVLQMDPQCLMQGQLMDKSELLILIDTGASKCFMSKAYYDKHPILHTAPKYPIKGHNVRVGDGRVLPVLFTTPIVFTTQGHMFEAYCLVTELGPSNEMVIGMKGLVELEASVNLRNLSVDFMDRSFPIHVTQPHTIGPGSKKAVKLQVQSKVEFSGLAIIKMLIGNHVHTLQMRFVQNACMMEITNATDDKIELNPKRKLGILDARSIGFYHVSHQALEQKLQDRYQFKYLHEIVQEEQASSPQEIFTKVKDTKEPYPWLAEDDPRRNMTDEQILHNTIKLNDSCLSDQEKEDLMTLIIQHKKAFSLRDEIGECPNLEIEIEVVDKSPFFVRPFRISEEDKPIMDRQMKRLVSLGILSRTTTSHTSPVMLIGRKMTSDKRPITDFRLLNSRILRRNHATPLMTDIRSILGNSQCEVFSCVDLKDAFHSIKLSKASKEYCGILPYFGSAHYRYEVLPMGLAISPAKWMEYVEVLLDNVKQRNKFICIIDDLLIHSSKVDHFTILEDLLKSLIKCGLKLSPKKCLFFKTKLLYMGNIFEITQDGVEMSVLKSRTEAIQELPPPKTPKDCKKFCGVANYLAPFCPDLQKCLAPIYDLTRKGRPFIWTEAHQEAFDVVKHKLMNPPVLTCPTSSGRYTLFTDTSRQHVGSCLWQRQNGKNKLIGYASKTLPSPCKNYGVTELEMFGMVVSIKMWAMWLGRNEFDCVVDHQAIVHIMKSKDPPATDRIKKFLEGLTNYNARYYYLKGKHMLISDFLSRMSRDPHPVWNIIPVGFTPKEILLEKMKEENNLLKLTDTCMITTRSAGQKLPEVHGANKELDPNYKPEHQHKSKQKATNVQKPLGLSTTGPTPTQKQAKQILQRAKATLVKAAQRRKVDPADQDDHVEQAPAPTTKPSHPPTQQRPQTSQPSLSTSMPTSAWTDKVRADKQPTTAKTHIQDIVPQPSGLEQDLLPEIPEVEQEHKLPDPKDFVVPPTLAEQVDQDEITAKYLPKQVDLDKVVKQVQQKLLRKIHFPTTLKDMQAAYLNSPYFKDIYVYLNQNKVPTQARRIARVNAVAYNYFILDHLLFKVEPDDTGEMVGKLCIPSSKVDTLLQLYHSSVMGGHQGVIKTLLTLRKNFFCPGLADHVQAYILGCHVCQMFKKGKKFNRPLEKRIHLNVPSFSRISMDIKHLPPSGMYKFLLVILCEITSYLNCVPLKAATAMEVTQALIQHHFKYFGPPQYLMCDKDPAFMAGLTEYMLKMFQVKVITVSPTNHQSLTAEHGIKSISNILTKTLVERGPKWTEFAALSQLAHNSAASPNLEGLSPNQLVFGHTPKLEPISQITPEIQIPVTHRQFLADLKKRIQHFQEKVQKAKDKRVDMQNKDREHHFFEAGDLVYLYQPRGAILQTGSKKITCTFVGPLVIYKVVAPKQFFLMSLDGILYPHLIEDTRLKPGYIHTTMGTVSTLSELKKVLRMGLSPTHK